MLARASPPCADDDDRLRFPAAPPSRNGKAEKKESSARHPSQLCPRYAASFSRCSPDHPHSGVRTAENGYATGSGLSRKCQSSARACTHNERIDRMPVFGGKPEISSHTEFFSV